MDVLSPDTELARDYDLDIESQYVSLGVFSLEVDHTDVGVQVNGGEYHEGFHDGRPPTHTASFNKDTPVGLMLPASVRLDGSINGIMAVSFPRASTIVWG